jgi:serine/threonine protein kinase/tetratricopeptide (TPR) repeat protein
MPALPLSPGRMLLHYRLVEPIGQGGMGIVWKALDTTLDRHVALKTLPAEVVQDPDRLARFEREAKFLASLNHPNIATIHGFHQSDGVLFLTMELVTGEDLSDRLRRGRLPIEVALQVAIEAAAAIEAAHTRGIVHRDLKPANIRFTGEHAIKVLDFGIAKALLPDGADPMTTLSAASTATGGVVIGTPAYMSPEQARGQALDRRSDVWALGCVLFEMLAGRPAFGGPTASDTIASVIRSEPDWHALPASIPTTITSLLRRCLTKDADQRLSDVSTARQILAGVLAGGAKGERAAAQVTPSVAVLPFVNMSGDPENQYFCDGLSEELINALTRLPDLKVASRTSAFRFRGSDQDIRRIGDELGVSTVVEGSVRRAGARLRVAVQLISVGDGYHIWSERYDRQMADVFDIQDDIVSAVVTALVPALRGRTGHAVRRPTDNLEAYEIYLKGRHFLHQRSPSTIQVAIQAFEQAIALDPEYVLAFSGLSDCYSLLAAYGWVSPDSIRPRALAAIERATALDPTLPEVHFSRGFFTMYLEREWRNAAAHFASAIAGDPRSSLAHAYSGLCLATLGRRDEAATHIERAATLDPTSPIAQGLGSIAWGVSERFERAADSARRALDLQPGYLLGLWTLAVAEVRLGDVDGGVRHAEQAVMVSRAPFFVGVLGLGYGLAGRTDDATRLLGELEERQTRGEHVGAVAPLSIHVGMRNLPAVRRDLASWAAAGFGAPTSLYCCGAYVREAGQEDPEIARLFNVLMGTGGTGEIS